ncbi:MAG: N-acetylmuramoyl-L-alanine amidase [Verrucomicrobiota bacterium]|nr:N-acetylmuramoyl-L-alanine amidase [Verrucomicrobiota bacterium]
MKAPPRLSLLLALALGWAGYVNSTPKAFGQAWTLHATLNWDQVDDWDLHLYGPNDLHVYYRRMTEGGFTLDVDAHPSCNEHPRPPETITGTGGVDGTYTIQSDLTSDCSGSPASSYYHQVFVERPIMINGVAYEPGETFLPEDGVPFTVRRPYVVVIDPGHGGIPPPDRVGGSIWNNAIGAISRVLEKNMTLAYAQALNQQLGIAAFNAQMAVTIVQTRDTDVNLGLFDRANVARDNGADLFISLHFNATDPPGRARGVETWIRRDDINVNEEEDRSFAQRVQTAVFNTINNLSPTQDRNVRPGGWDVLDPKQAWFFRAEAKKSSKCASVLGLLVVLAKSTTQHQRHFE